MIRSGILISILFACSRLFSQSIAGKILDPQNGPVAYSPVALLAAKDSSVYKGTISDDTGYFIFGKIDPGVYLLKFSIIGFEERTEGPFELLPNTDLEMATVQLQPLNGANLDEIQVSTFRRGVEFKNGNITVHVDNSALAAGNTAYDLLMKLPGVSVRDEAISIQGREGVKVLIDNRMQQLSPAQLISLLKSISGASIEKIEVLKNPPVKYDAAGTAGLINIRTKKTKLTGFSGVIATSGSQGFYPRGETSLSLNFKHKQLTLFGDLSTEYGKYISQKKFDRILLYGSEATSLNQRQVDHEKEKALQANLGFDLQLSRKLLVGMKVTVGPGEDGEGFNGTTLAGDTHTIYNRSPYQNTLLNTWNYMNLNMNAEWQFDTAGTKLIFSADYSPNWDKYTGTFDHRFLKNDQDVTAPKIARIYLDEEFDLLSSKLDLEKRLSESMNVETGMKLGNQQLSRKYLFENKDLQSETYREDNTYSNHFLYSERILAGYVNIGKEFDEFEISAGLRAENTSIFMKSPDKNFSASRTYFNLFPVFSMEFEPDEKNNFQLSYNRRINRPDAYSYYPYKIYQDNILISEGGNARLLPEYGNTVEFTHVYKGIFSNALAYSRLNNYLLNYTIQSDSSQEIMGTVTNLKQSHTFGYTVFCDLKIRNWWVFSGNAMLSYFFFNGKVNDQDYSSSGLSTNMMLRNELATGKKSKLEISSQFFGPQPVGVFVIKPKWALNIAFKRKLFNEKLDLVVGMDDIFYTFIDRFGTDFQDQSWSMTSTRDSRRFRLSLSYNFGKLKVERREISSNEEEKERLKH